MDFRSTLNKSKSPMKYGNKKNSLAVNALDYAGEAYKETAIIQDKLNTANLVNDGLRRDLFQKQLENEDLRQRL
jgi:hypothetical protein